MKTKKCCACKTIKDISEFAKNKSQSDGYNGTCNTCKKRYQADWYKRNKPEQLKRIYRNKENIAIYIRNLKESTPCTDCGKYFKYYIMDFDHRENKKFNLGDCKLHGFNKVKEEIEKCDIICSNCHRERTHKRRMGD